MHITKVSTTNFYGITPKSTIKSLANKAKQESVDFSQFAYSIPEKAVAAEAPRSTAHDMSPKQINVREIILNSKKATKKTEEKPVNIIFDSTII